MEAKEVLKEEILVWGFVETKEEYYQTLASCDVVVSCTDHEFYGYDF